MAAMEMAVAMAAQAGQAQPKLTVWIESPRDLDVVVLAGAEGTAARIFAQVDVKLEWKIGTPPANAPGENLAMAFDAAAPARFDAGALGYATVGGSGTTIHIFYYRVLRQNAGELLPVILGHVMAHEITHVLEGIPRHSDTGLMKAQWQADDYYRMSRSPLPFAPIDADMVRAHFAREAAALPQAPGAAQPAEPVTDSR
jgi:hypothetical protein